MYFKVSSFSRSFQSYFSNDVTAFFPPSAMVNRSVDEKKNVMGVFSSFFSRVKVGKVRPPYLDITPQKMTISIVNELAIIVFELDDTPFTRFKSYL